MCRLELYIQCWWYRLYDFRWRSQLDMCFENSVKKPIYPVCNELNSHSSYKTTSGWLTAELRLHKSLDLYCTKLHFAGYSSTHLQNLSFSDTSRMHHKTAHGILVCCCRVTHLCHVTCTLSFSSTLSSMSCQQACINVLIPCMATRGPPLSYGGCSSVCSGFYYLFLHEHKQQTSCIQTDFLSAKGLSKPLFFFENRITVSHMCDCSERRGISIFSAGNHSAAYR